MDHWKYTYAYNQAFTNQSSFGIKYSIRSWYVFKQINHIKQGQRQVLDVYMKQILK